MKLEQRAIDEASVLAVSGDVDMSTSPDLRDALFRMTKTSAKRIVVDLSGVEFMDSSGIATLVQALKETKNYGGALRLAAPGGNVLRVLELSNLTALFPVFDTVAEATAP